MSLTGIFSQDKKKIAVSIQESQNYHTTFATEPQCGHSSSTSFNMKSALRAR